MKDKKQTPPKFFLSFFRWFCHPDMSDYIEGDLMEVYDRNLKKLGKRKADWKFIFDVLLLFRPGIIKPRQENHNLNSNNMFKSYFKIGWRTLIRNKEYALMNIAGLALSITCCLFIFTLVKHHLGFDNFHENKDRIYRIVTEMHSENEHYSTGVPTPLGALVRDNQTFSEKTARIFIHPNALITLTDKEEKTKYKEPEGVTFAEPEFFEIFNFPLIKGSIESSMNTVNAAVISEGLALKYFGDKNPIGETILMENDLELSITGILKDIPDNTGFRSEIIVSFPTFEAFMPWLASDDFWAGISGNLQTFVLLNPSTSTYEAEEALTYYAQEYPMNKQTKSVYQLQALNDIHFIDRFGGGVIDKNHLWILSAIGIFLLLTACVNFINLATAQALRRAKEVGVRKTMGGQRWQLFWQFMVETGIITAISIIIAIVAAYTLLPSLNNLYDINLRLDLFSNTSLILFIVVLGLVITFLAGFYPGYLLGVFQPITAFRQKLSQQHIGGFNLRRSLIVTQFVISQVLIISLIVVINQMRFTKNADLGFDKEAIVMVKAGDNAASKMEAVKNEINRLPGVQQISLCNNAPASSDNWETDILWGSSQEKMDFLINMKLVDENYVSTFNLDIIYGRNLVASDTVMEILANETLLKQLRIINPEDALGTQIAVNSGNMKGQIVGVVKDFHDKSFHEAISPIVLASASRHYSSFAIKMDPRDYQNTLEAINATWQENYQDQVFEYAFLDDRIEKFYETENMMLSGIQLFSLITLSISCLGLYGLISFMVAQKTKEVGIRKVMGSGVTHIIWLFGKEFARLVLIGFVIASPIGWWFMQNWLREFEFRIQIDVWTFVIAGVGTLLIAAITIGYQVLRVAYLNPVLSLKAE
ncbi:FtsX-like permease family protein [Litoribacter populi]|uniref:FtsX-like permease family protein n=1 Tax=Litoribacter populi TaxID=2598460 RepID=UPI00117EBBB3|nr:FtsX-like permease family protein [Litoribacter populi]